VARYALGRAPACRGVPGVGGDVAVHRPIARSILVGVLLSVPLDLSILVGVLLSVPLDLFFSH